MAWLAVVLRLAWPWSAQYAEPIARYAEKYEFDPLLVAAVVYQESRFRNSICYTGSHGLMQVQLKPRSCPLTMAEARRQGLYEPGVNVERGVRLMSWWRGWWRRHHKDDGYHWLLHYNQGFGRVCPWPYSSCGRTEKIPVTTGKVGGYADRVLQIYRKLRRIKSELPRPAV
mgnify:CR=1 FL=1